MLVRSKKNTLCVQIWKLIKRLLEISIGNLGRTSSKLVVCHNVARLLRQVRRIQWLLGWGQSCKNVRTTSTIDLFSLFWLKMDWLSLRCCRRACPPLLQVNQGTPVADHYRRIIQFLREQWTRPKRKKRYNSRSKSGEGGILFAPVQGI